MSSTSSLKPGSHINEMTLFDCNDKMWKENIDALGEGNYIIFPINGRSAEDEDNLTKVFESNVAKIETRLEDKYIAIKEDDPKRETKLRALEKEKDKLITAATEDFKKSLRDVDKPHGEILCAKLSAMRIMGWQYNMDENGNIITNNEALADVLKHNILAVRGIAKVDYIKLPLTFFFYLIQQIINVSYLGEKTSINYSFGEVKKK